MHDSAVSPCFHGCQVPPKTFPTIISSLTRPCPGISLQFIYTSSQPVCFLGDLHPFQQYVRQQQGLSVWFLFHLEYQISCFTRRLKWFSSVPNNCSNVGIRDLLQFPHPSRAGAFLLTLLFFPLLSPSYWVLCDSIFFFQWSATPAWSQLVFCKILCVWKHISDVSGERDILHIHLLLHRHFLLNHSKIFFTYLLE